MFETHLETDCMTSEEIGQAIGETEEKLKHARELGDKEVEVWFTQEIRSLEAALRRRNGEMAPKGKRESQADRMIQMFEDSGCELFHTPLDDTFATLPVGDHFENWPVRSKAVRQWLTRMFYASTNKAPNSEALQNTLNLLEARARFDGNKTEIHLRTAWAGGDLYYDLADDLWRAVKITKSGWEIVKNPPVKFQRYRHMAAQVEPLSGGDLEDLFKSINIKGDEQVLIKSFVTVGLIPDIPRPALVLHGDQGSGKSCTARRLRSIIDPSSMPLLRGKDEIEVVQGLAHHFCAILDNLSSVPDWLSDLLSRSVTGEGFTKRMLYTDADDVLFAYRRVLILTGIGLVVVRADLLDRSIIVGVDRITDSLRKEEKSLDLEFETARPKLFGAVLDLLVGALRQYDAINVKRLPRMADFARWSLAVEAGQGHKPIEWQQAYRLNVERQNDEALAASVVAQVLIAFLEDKTDWSGRPEQLYTLLKDQAERMKIPAKGWPGNASILGRRLREIRPNFQAVGWKIDFGPSSGPRLTTIASLNRENDENGVIVTSAANANIATSPISSASVSPEFDWEDI